jgi:glycosyltransferase involved in cell wall biosynthesis
VKARATVIIPTFGNAEFACWAVKSVQQQTVKEIEICIICDGSPENMISFFRGMANDDPRIKVYGFPKSPRTGEPYRDTVIRRTTGEIICYCSHDDLWLPYHLEEMEKTLKKCRFTHSLHASVNLPEKIGDENTLFGSICCINLENQKTVRKMQEGNNYFGLTFGAHTRESYNGLMEGWVTTPRPEIPTDLYMWCKLIAVAGNRRKTTMKITALSFPQIHRNDWSEQERDAELKQYFDKLQDPVFLRNIELISSRFHPSLFRRVKLKVRESFRNLLPDTAS